jgi:O-antigen/teichoic acid export membrane protein
MSEQPPARRVRVTSPHSGATRRRKVAVTHEIDAQTEVGEVYMRSLIATQRRLALLLLGVVGVLIGGLPALFALVPPLRQAQVLGLPLPWLLLAGLVYPAMVVLGWFYVRQAERVEREFSDLVERS